jgi:hypothetical protein
MGSNVGFDILANGPSSSPENGGCAMRFNGSISSALTALPALCPKTLRTGSLAAILAMVTTSGALAVDPTFTIEIPPSGSSPGILRVPAVYPDTNGNGEISANEAVKYAELCRTVTNLSGDVPLFSPPDDSDDYKRRRAIAVVNAMLRAHTRPQDFLMYQGYPGTSTGPGNGITLPSGSPIVNPIPTSSTNCVPTNPPTVIVPLCSSISTATAAVTQSLFGLSVDPSTMSMIFIPDPEYSLLNCPLPPSSPAPALGTPNPCQAPSPEVDPSATGPMPNGDGPGFCQSEVKPAPGGGWVNPCDGTAIPGNPPEIGEPDIIWCSSASPCSSPVPDPTAPGDPNHPVPSQPPVYPCASGNACVPDCDDIACAPSDPPREPPIEEMCSGAHCTAPEPLPPPNETVPDASKDPNAIYHPPIDMTPPEKDPIIYCGADASRSMVSAPVGGSASCQPVDLINGYKLEREVDLVIPLTGREFQLSREYSTNPTDQAGAGLFGAGWSSPLFREMQVLTDSSSNTRMLLRGAKPNQFTSFQNFSGIWKPVGASKNSAVIDTTNHVVRYTEIGVGITEFYYNNPGFPELEGRLKLQRDVYGNTWTFTYRFFEDTAGSSQPSVARLHRIYLNGTDESDAEALVEFGYYLADSSLSNSDIPFQLRGKVGRVIAARILRKDGEDPVIYETNRLEYTYKNPRDPFSSDVGTTGDLIQVVKYSRVDQQPLDGYESQRTFGPKYPHRAAVLQYRYHTTGIGVSPSAETTTTLEGKDHQLKSVFRPEQLEYYA